MADGIQYVGTRYDELYDLLDWWGYEVVPDPDFSRWQETLYTSPLTGLVKVTGRRDDLTVKFEEFWVKGDRGEEAALVREGASLVRYHYHCQASNGGIRWCFYPEDHPDDPIHVHPFPEAGDPVICDPIDPKMALKTFEDCVYMTDCGPSEQE